MWYYVPSMDSAFVPVSEGLSWPLGSSTDPNILVSVTSKGTLTPRLPSWRGWKVRHWTTRLSGAISNPSQASITAKKWMSSRLVSHASPSAQPVTVLARMTLGGSGLLWSSTSQSLAPQSSSWRMSPVYESTDSLKSWKTLPPSGSMQSGIISEQVGLEARIDAIGSSYWPTPTARDYKGSDNKRIGSPSLPEKVMNHWPTPAAWDGQRGPDLARMKRPKSGGHDLVTAVSLWPTPTALDSMSSGAKGYTPAGRNIQKSMTLTDNTVRHPPSHLDLTTKKDGEPGLVLNPVFVEALMGLPSQWSAAIDSDASETQSYQLWQQQHSLILQTVLDLDLDQQT